MVTLARRTTTELTGSGKLEAFCDRFLGLLHDFEGIDDKDTNSPVCKGEMKLFSLNSPQLLIGDQSKLSRHKKNRQS